MYLLESTEDFRSCAERVRLEDDEFSVKREGHRAMPLDGLLRRQEIKDLTKAYFIYKVSKA